MSVNPAIVTKKAAPKSKPAEEAPKPAKPKPETVEEVMQSLLENVEERGLNEGVYLAVANALKKVNEAIKLPGNVERSITTPMNFKINAKDDGWFRVVAKRDIHYKQVRSFVAVNDPDYISSMHEYDIVIFDACEGTTTHHTIQCNDQYGPVHTLFAKLKKHIKIWFLVNEIDEVSIEHTLDGVKYNADYSYEDFVSITKKRMGVVNDALADGTWDDEVDDYSQDNYISYIVNIINTLICP